MSLEAKGNGDGIYDAVLFLSFGGPEGPDEVIPFLENVLRGRNVPRERMVEVAEHYYHFGGVSPINEQNRRLITALEAQLNLHGPRIPVYFGNRNWRPYLKDALVEMRDHGVRRAIAFFTSAFSSYSGCRQYRENLIEARLAVGDGAPEIDKTRAFHNHPDFLHVVCERITECWAEWPEQRRQQATVLFTAHSIPLAMAAGCRYESQLNDSCAWVANRLGLTYWQLVYQSRSGPPTQPWLEPDVNDALRTLNDAGRSKDVVLVPIGFISDHMEVMFDLDYECKILADQLGLNMLRAATLGDHPRFVRMIRDLIAERAYETSERPIVGDLAACPDVCPVDCCLSGRPTAAARS